MKTKLTLGSVALVAVLALVATNTRGQSQDAIPIPDNDLRLVPRPSIEAMVARYVELSSQLANRMTLEELETAITELTLELDQRDADDKIQSIQESLQDVIDSHPDSPAAETARRALEGFIPEVEPSNVRPLPEGVDDKFSPI